MLGRMMSDDVRDAYEDTMIRLYELVLAQDRRIIELEAEVAKLRGDNDD